MIDAIALLEAAYAMGGSEQAWLSRLVEGARVGLQNEPAVFGWTYDASGNDLPRIRHTACEGADPGRIAQTLALEATLPHPLRNTISRIYRTSFVENLRRAPEILQKAGIDAERAHRFGILLNGFLHAQKIEDALLVNAQDPTHVGCLLAATRDGRRPLAPREIHQWRCVAAHIATAFRIRRRLAASADEIGVCAQTEGAALRPDGTADHTEGGARSEPARAALRRAVLSVARGQGALRRQDPEAVSIWHALVAGRWSLVDFVDSAGRRFVVAHKNDARVPDQRGLTLRERQVLAYSALGHSNKCIAYELGLSTSTVAGHLTRARAKAALPSLSAISLVADATVH